MLEHEIQQEERIERDRKHYAERDVRALGHHYINHVAAMTNEGLHSKSDIAAELAHRDQERDELLAALKDARKALAAASTRDPVFTDDYETANALIARMEAGK